MIGRLPGRSPRASLRTEIEKVVASGNCSGCGLCATMSDRVRMELDADGYLRPVWDDTVADTAPNPGPDSNGDAALAAGRRAVRSFRAACPGVGQRAHTDVSAKTHPTMGPYVSAWSAHAADADVRRAGSSAGVLTALSGWLIESGRASSVIGAGATAARPTRTVALRLSSKGDALTTAGSRYAPVGVAALYDAQTAATDIAVVGKPCEAYAIRQRASDPSLAPAHQPLILSFFCAGVPSQFATEELAQQLVGDSEVVALRYRGNGWPGKFSVRTADGRVAEVGYEESWGKVLGPRVQSRCKICPDGIGEHADIAVGDFWAADDRGYPVFTESDGNSVAIARTRRGHDALLAAAAAGVVELNGVDLDEVARVQPLQVQRRRTIAPRLLGRLLAGLPIPRYRGYRLLWTEFRTANSAREFLHEFVRTARGSRMRAVRDSRAAKGSGGS